MYLTRDGKRYKTPEYKQARKRIGQLATDPVMWAVGGLVGAKVYFCYLMLKR